MKYKFNEINKERSEVLVEHDVLGWFRIGFIQYTGGKDGYWRLMLNGMKWQDNQFDSLDKGKKFLRDFNSSKGPNKKDSKRKLECIL